jgi:hypothetical protein
MKKISLVLILFVMTSMFVLAENEPYVAVTTNETAEPVVTSGGGLTEPAPCEALVEFCSDNQLIITHECVKGVLTPTNARCTENKLAMIWIVTFGILVGAIGWYIHNKKQSAKKDNKEEDPEDK